MSQPVASYKSPPIERAIIEIVIKPQKDSPVEALFRLGKRLESLHAKMRTVRVASVNINQETATITDTGSRDVGIVIESAEEIIQFNTDRFIYVFKGRYTNWSNFSSRAKELWAKYRAVVKPTSLERLGLRYVNKLNLSSGHNMRDYFSTLPVPPKIEGTEHALERFFIEMDVPNITDNLSAVLRQGIQSPEENDSERCVLLDIDVFHAKPEALSIRTLWSTYEKLRHLKNKIFEATITQKCREGFWNEN